MMPPELKARILASTEREASPTRQTAHARVRLVVLIAIGAALLLFAGASLLFALFREPAPERPMGFVVGTAAGWCVVGVSPPGSPSRAGARCTPCG